MVVPKHQPIANMGRKDDLMSSLTEPSVMELANDYIAEGKATLEQIEACFRKLPHDDQKRVFGSLCIRKRHVGTRLINLLFALAPVVNTHRTVVLRLLLNLWQSKHGEGGLDESMRQALAELHAP